MVFELNMTSPCRHIQPVADITYLLKALNLRKKHLPKKDDDASFHWRVHVYTGMDVHILELRAMQENASNKDINLR